MVTSQEDSAVREAGPEPGARMSDLLPAYLIRSLVAVLIGSLILRVAAQMMSLMLQYYFARINELHYPISYSVMGLVTASFFITELSAAPILGAMSDRFGRKPFMILGPLFGAIAVQITSLTILLWILAITRLLEGLSTASSIPATLGYISEATAGRPHLRARVVGLFEITLVGGMALGSVAGGYLWEFFSEPRTIAGIELMSPAFAINALVYLLSLAIFAWGMAEIKREAPVSRGSAGIARRYAVLLKSPLIWRFVPAWLAVNSIIGMWLNHSARLMTVEADTGQNLMGGFSQAAFGIGFAAFAIVFSLGVLGWSFYLGRHSRSNIMLVATGGLFVLLLSAYAINHLSSLEGSLYYLLVGILLIGVVVSSGFTPAALTYLADITEAHTADRGSIMGLYSVFLGIGQVVGTTSGGLFADWSGIDGLLLLSGIFGVITVFTLVVLRRHEQGETLADGH